MFTLMTIQFSTAPGIFERYQQLKYNNPLFSGSEEVTETSTEDARDLDQLAHETFMHQFQQVVQEIVSLDNESESQTVLNLKTKLDQCFEACATLPGDLTEIRAAIQKLMAPIMQAIQTGAADDPTATAKLVEEDEARAIHYSLLETPLVADLLKADTPMPPEELPATLLSSDPVSLEMALTLFAPEQLSTLLDDSTSLLDQLTDTGLSIESALPQLEIIKLAFAKQEH